MQLLSGILFSMFKFPLMVFEVLDTFPRNEDVFFLGSKDLNHVDPDNLLIKYHSKIVTYSI